MRQVADGNSYNRPGTAFEEVMVLCEIQVLVSNMLAAGGHPDSSLGAECIQEIVSLCDC